MIAQTHQRVTSADLTRVSRDELSADVVEIVDSAGAHPFRLAPEHMPPHADGFVMETDSTLAVVVDATLDTANLDRVVRIALTAWFHAGPGEYRDPATGTRCIAVGRRGAEDAR